MEAYKSMKVSEQQLDEAVLSENINGWGVEDLKKGLKKELDKALGGDIVNVKFLKAKGQFEILVNPRAMLGIPTALKDIPFEVVDVKKTNYKNQPHHIMTLAPLKGAKEKPVKSNEASSVAKDIAKANKKLAVTSHGTEQYVHHKGDPDGESGYIMIKVNKGKIELEYEMGNFGGSKTFNDAKSAIKHGISVATGRNESFEGTPAITENVKTTKQDPLVAVYKNGNIHTHANLSVAAKIHGFSANGLADKVHKAGVEKQIKIGDGLTIELSKHHAKEVKEELELDEFRAPEVKTFKSLEDWLMAVLDIKGATVSKMGNSLRANGLGRSQSATFELKKGRGSLLEEVQSVELEEAMGDLSKQQIDKLKKSYGSIDKIDVTGPAYKKMKNWIKTLDKEDLTTLAKAKVKWVSQFAANELRMTHNIKLPAKDWFVEGVEELELEEKKLDPVNDKENDKKFKDREDKDIDNDGDVDSSDEYLHKKRAATDDAIDAEDDEEKKDIKKNPKTKDAKAEISKIESVNTHEAFIAMWSDLEEAINQKKGATAPEAIDSKESPKSKEFIAKHKKSDKKIEDGEEEGHATVFNAGGKTMKQAKQPK